MAMVTRKTTTIAKGCAHTRQRLYPKSVVFNMADIVLSAEEESVSELNIFFFIILYPHPYWFHSTRFCCVTFNHLHSSRANCQSPVGKIYSVSLLENQEGHPLIGATAALGKPPVVVLGRRLHIVQHTAFFLCFMCVCRVILGGSLLTLGLRFPNC